MQFTEPVIIAYTKGKVMCEEVDFALNVNHAGLYSYVVVIQYSYLL